MRTIITLFIIVLVSVNTFAQKVKLDKVTTKELQEEQHKTDPSAPAAILQKKGITYFDFDNSGNWIIITQVAVKAKIYTTDGYYLATVAVPYYEKGLEKEKVSFLSAATYNLEGGKVEKTKLKNESEFEEKQDDNWKIKKIVLPAVKEGSVIEYTYEIQSPFIRHIPTWYFQMEVPVNNIDYEIRIPQYFTYNRILSPYIPIKEEEDTERATKVHNSKYTKGAYGRTSSVLKNEVGSVSFYEIIKNYTAENVPALKGEDYVDNIKNYLSFVKHELAKTKFPNQKEKNYASDWDGVVRLIYSDQNFGTQLEQKEYFEEDLRKLVGEKNPTTTELVNIVYNYVKDRMTFNEKYGYECEQGVRKAYNAKTGNVAEINLMLVAMLRYAGLNANPVLLSTRSNGHVSFVNQTEFNYVVAGLESQNGIKLLDATSKNGVPGLLPTRALNGTGRVIRENLSSEEVYLAPEKTSLESAIVMATINTDGSIQGQVRKQYTDYSAYDFRNKYSSRNQDTHIAKTENEFGNIILSDYKVTNAEKLDKPAVERFSFKGNTGVDVIGDKIYLSPMLFYTTTENPFKQDERAYPIDFKYPRQQRYNISITVPEGYTVESLPETATIAMDGNICVFNLTVTQKANQIQITTVKSINVAMLASDSYKELKVFYNDMIKKQNEKIVLKKQ
ncbi:DUF3857 domain-containing protein [Flavobacterium litorale]|uniref:DUF3857 domain-containing protein n=1 Tax=Flavobacterium litorale TaxID=2856519 RepID=A0ABX8V2T3_9FLAO|nr:DUF3857 domain-containing protein [Flavobacterium litorale]QYJ67156.1 DUF3857 domain-containing protein [Flavobacterium litorale]